MQVELILSFLTASILLSLMPGPDNIFVLTESLTRGVRTGVIISTGLASGVLIHTLAAATGISLILQQSELAFSIVQYLGAAYMFYLAWQATREKPMEVDLEAASATMGKSSFQLLRKGFLMNILNPKVSLFFIAFLPQFVSKEGYSPMIQMIILGVIFMVQALLIFSFIAALSGRLSSQLNSPRFWNATKWSKFVVLVVLGVSLVVSGV